MTTANAGQSNRLLLVLLIAAIAAAAVFGGMLFGKGGAVSDDKIEAAVENFIAEKPEKLIEALQRGQQAQAQRKAEEAQQSISKKRNELEKDDGTPVFGNPEGDVVIVKFSDYNCGYCKRVMPTLNELLGADSNIKVVVKDFPILGPQSVQNAKAALAVYALDEAKYQGFHEAMLKRTPRNQDQLVALAGEFGVDKNRLLAKMEEASIGDQLAENMKLGQSIGVQGTPAFVVNGEFVRGAIGVDEFKRLIEDARG